MAEQPPNPTQPVESTLALSFLREDIQDLRAEMIQLINQTNGRIDDLRTEMNQRIDDLAKQLDSRYARLMAMLIACTSIIVTAIGVAVAVLK